ncbi:alpha-amylase family glycosyl hydrolase [Paenibacillus sp. Soil787]|uniref:alpha-amylase family glycosyl hydrolase n=1 Tax=Paenibacillus sp. Soil787 TaxID=1736411 RepID=UPI0006FD3D64|nr:alpha-amylase family glycosyl hydrolase [Paenibacillus sp. Soil787]KRF43873.1 hypothetical protein ASG93_02865 [Paenibacillus sp. Soil787]
MYENFTAIPSPEWIEKSVIYELHIRAFTDDGFNGLTDKIDYFKNLGINTLWLMPFNEVGHEGRLGKYGDPYAERFYSFITLISTAFQEMLYEPSSILEGRTNVHSQFGRIGFIIMKQSYIDCPNRKRFIKFVLIQ